MCSRWQGKISLCPRRPFRDFPLSATNSSLHVYMYSLELKLPFFSSRFTSSRVSKWLDSFRSRVSIRTLEGLVSTSSHSSAWGRWSMVRIRPTVLCATLSTNRPDSEPSVCFRHVSPIPHSRRATVDRPCWRMRRPWTAPPSSTYPTHPRKQTTIAINDNIVTSFGY